MFGVQYLFATIGLLLVVIALPLALRRVPRNHWYGLRVPSTLSDDGIWFDANAASGRDLACLGALVVAVSLALGPAVVASEDRCAAILALLTGVGALSVSGWGWRRANRMHRAKRRGEGPGGTTV